MPESNRKPIQTLWIPLTINGRSRGRDWRIASRPSGGGAIAGSDQYLTSQHGYISIQNTSYKSHFYNQADYNNIHIIVVCFSATQTQIHHNVLQLMASYASLKFGGECSAVKEQQLVEKHF